MQTDSVPLWLWRAVTWGFGLSLIGVTALAVALANGLADPPRAGPLLWQDDFKGDVTRWQFEAAPGATLTPRDGALVASFIEAEQTVTALTDGPAGDFTLEMAAAQTEGEIGARYGLVFGWRGPSEYNVVWLNGNGYAEAFARAGPQRAEAFPFQQWPHILYGNAPNRVRVEVRGARVTARLNDELLAEFDAGAPGRLGLIARSTGPGRVVFSWIKVWAKK
jgi:hypothetical protein